jgi:hypothetical protein
MDEANLPKSRIRSMMEKTSREANKWHEAHARMEQEVDNLDRDAKGKSTSANVDPRRSALSMSPPEKAEFRTTDNLEEQPKVNKARELE